MTGIRPIVLAAAAAALALGALPGAAAAATAPPGAAFTPLAASTVARPMAVATTDGHEHIAYELLLTNVSPLAARLDEVRVSDARTGRTLLTLSGAALAANANPIGDAGAADPTAIAPSQTSIVWLDVEVADRADLPRALAHRVTTTLTRPTGETASITAPAGRVALDRTAPSVLHAPVGRGDWVADEGCCAAPTHHRRSLQVIDGRLVVSQRFAIDWMKLDAEHRAWTGDPADPASYVSWEEPEYAVRAGTVVAARDGLQDYPVPHGPPTPPKLDEALGNHVILRIGAHRYVTYAHMRRGSVVVRVGQRVRSGQMLGRLGNSGNSSTPHLHLQMQSSPYALSGDNLPFTFARLDLLGRITEPFSDETLGLRSDGALPFAAAARPGVRRDEMPLDGSVVRFPDARG
jgi:Peptidase family M23